MSYKEFLDTKVLKHKEYGFKIERNEINDICFEYQKDIIKWSLLKGKCAVFADTGLGKTIIQIEIARIIHQTTGKNIIILAPLAVSEQTILEGKEKLGININNLRNGFRPGINITNYEQIHNINDKDYDCVILDESSILKNFSGKMRNKIIDKFENYDFKFCFSATPAPNDFMELGSHSEFLNILKSDVMLSMFFTNDLGDFGKWVLRGHGKEAFWKWISSWACILKHPENLGYYDDRFNLPKLHIHEHIVDLSESEMNLIKVGLLKIDSKKTLTERRNARKNSIELRTDYTSEKVNSSDDYCLIWCGLNEESSQLSKKIIDAYEINGSHSTEYKAETMLKFSNGEIRCIVTKPSIAGFGMNWQHCNEMYFVGLDDSFEKYYQAIRRCWRFGQKRDVNVHIIISKEEGTVLKNIKRKEKQAQEMARKMIKYSSQYVKESIFKLNFYDEFYNPTKDVKIPDFLKEIK